MKIVHWITLDYWGGAETLFKDCCVEMSKRGHSILAMVPHGSVLHEKLLNHTNTVDLVPLRRYRRKYRWWTMRKFNRILNEFAPDIFVLHTELTVRFIYEKLKITENRRWPLVAFVPYPLHGKSSSGIVDAIIPHTINQATINYHIDMIDSNFSAVVPVFSSFAPIEGVKRKSRIRNIIAVGRLVPVKGFDYLIDAMHILTTKGYDLQLNIVGDGFHREHLVRKRDDLNLAKVVHFIGESHQIDKLLNQSDLFVCSSVEEPFGIVLLEAMASGLPIVATKTNGPLEIFDEYSAILVDKESGSALSKGIQMAIEDMDASYTRACNALDIYKEYYSADAVVPKFIEVFQRCVDDRKHAYHKL